jgi:hypothetical protein
VKVVVVKPYDRPFENPIAVAAKEPVAPDFDKRTDIEGWVWCTAKDNRSGWVPISWLAKVDGAWRVSRQFNAIELTVVQGETLDVTLAESGFFWATKQNGEAGWIPCGNVSVAEQT